MPYSSPAGKLTNADNCVAGKNDALANFMFQEAFHYNKMKNKEHIDALSILQFKSLGSVRLKKKKKEINTFSQRQ